MKKIKKFEKELILAFVLGVVVSSLLTLWGDFGETTGKILSFNWWLAPLVLLLTCLNYLLRFFRWHIFLRRVKLNRLNLQNSLLVFLSGLPLTLTPGKSGEVLKAYFLKRVVGDHLSKTVPVVITERLTDGLGALVLLSLGFYFYPFGWTALLFTFIICSLFIFLIYHDPFWRLLHCLLEKLKRKMVFLKKFEELEDRLLNFRKVFLELIGVKNLCLGVGLATAAWLAEAVGFSIIVANLTSQPLTLQIVSKSTFIFCFASILGFVSLLPGGLGVAEGGFVGMSILLLKLSRPQAAAATILLRLFTLWWGVAIGLAALSFILRQFKHLK